MIAFDTDILSEICAEHPVYTSRAAAIPRDEQSVPVVAAAEMLRGWLAAIRSAEAGKGKMSLQFAFDMFTRSMSNAASYSVLPYTTESHRQFETLRAAKVRIGTNDLRIAAICMAHNAKLVTRNARDYTLVPGLNLEVWN